VPQVRATCMNENIPVGAAFTFNKCQYDRAFESTRFTNLASESSRQCIAIGQMKSGQLYVMHVALFCKFGLLSQRKHKNRKSGVCHFFPSIIMISKATPETVLIIKFRKRSVALLRDKCFTYEVSYIDLGRPGLQAFARPFAC